MEDIEEDDYETVDVEEEEREEGYETEYVVRKRLSMLRKRISEKCKNILLTI